MQKPTRWKILLLTGSLLILGALGLSHLIERASLRMAGMPATPIVTAVPQLDYRPIAPANRLPLPKLPRGILIVQVDPEVDPQIVIPVDPGIDPEILMQVPRYESPVDNPSDAVARQKLQSRYQPLAEPVPVAPAAPSNYPTPE